VKSSTVVEERALRKYRQKRKPESTPEPMGSKGKRTHIYVIQKHFATRLHYDLRLEHKDVLLSWAVPKEPSFDPSVKRLAVHVEDHPVDYADFEGTIPEGNYGAGRVEIWDKGTWVPKDDDVDAALAKGDLKFELQGGRLAGEWVLVRMGEPSEKENWLLIRHDGGKRREQGDQWEDSTTLTHQLCELRTSLPSGAGWQFEVKWDGYRAFLVVDKGEPRFLSRGGNPIPIPTLEKRIAKDLDKPCVLDGELIVLDRKNVSDFSLLQEALSKNRSKIQFVAFDLLRLEDKDLRRTTLTHRRKEMEELLRDVPANTLTVSPIIPGRAAEVQRQACELGLEGIVAKKLDSPYVGRRAPSWVKVKCRSIDDAWVVGYTKLKDSERAVGALILAKADSRGYSYVGRVGTGFDYDDRHALYERLEKRRSDRSTVEGLSAAQRKGVVWVNPEFEVLLEYASITQDGIFRQASYQGVKKKSEMSEAPVQVKPSKPRSSRASVRLTSGDRKIDPVTGSTKQDVFDFYDQMGDWMLPFVKGRFASIVRCPEGLAAECFFQKHIMTGKYKSLKETKVGEDEYLTLQNVTAILEAVQMGVLEFHVWGSKTSKLEKPDTLIFDLDPGPGIAWADVLEGSDILKRQFESLGLRPFYKLSGGKGVHIVLSVKPEMEWDQAKNFCMTFAHEMVRQNPKLFVGIMTKDKRSKRIYIDYHRNGRGATAVAPYSLRAREGLGVAMPVSWDELQSSRSADQFNIRNALKHVETRSSNPWGDFAAAAVSLKRTLNL